MCVSGYKFYEHDYYVLPYVPLMAWMGGYALREMNIGKGWKYLILSFVVLISLSGQYHDVFISRERMAVTRLDDALDDLRQDAGPIALNSGMNPTPLYFTHRRGWTCSNERLTNDSFRKELEEKGCTHYVILKNVFGKSLKLDEKLVAETSGWSMYEAVPR